MCLKSLVSTTAWQQLEFSSVSRGEFLFLPIMHGLGFVAKNIFRGQASEEGNMHIPL